MAYGILFLRLVLGGVIAAHGAQKVFGAFGGGGLRGTATTFAGLGYRAPLAMAFAAGLCELGGGLFIALGLLTPLAALALAVVQLNAIAAVHLRNGFWNTNGGYEYNVLLWAGAVALAATGGARFSLDHAIGWEHDLRGLWWGLGVLCGSFAVATATSALGRRARPAPLPRLERREARRRAA